MASVAEGVNIIVHTNAGANPYLRAICKSICSNDPAKLTGSYPVKH